MSNKMVNSLLVISALAFGSLLTGCGKSKETKTAAPPVIADQGQNPAPGGGRQNGRTPGTGDGSKAPLPAQPPQTSQPPTTPPPPTRPPVAQPPPPTVPSPGTVNQPQMPPNLPNSHERVNFDGPVVKTGGVKAAAEKMNDLYYTGASDDLLLETLLVSLNFKSDAERSIDLQIARDIKFAKLSIDRETGKRVLSISTKEEATREQIFQLIESDQNANILVPKARLYPTQYGILKAASAELICMDKNPAKNSLGVEKCLVTVAKVQFVQGQAQIIFRKNHALINAKFVVNPHDLETRQNGGLEMWKDYISGRVDQIITEHKMEEVIVSSYEVVGGKSEMGVLVTAADGSSAGIRVPLLATLLGSTVNTAAYLHNHVDNKFDFSDYAARKQVRNFALGNAIETARLTKNNGRGDVIVTLTFDQRAVDQDPADQSRLNLVISRNNTPIDLQKLSRPVN